MENNYQLSRIHNYVMGLMDKQEMYELEREALNDPFLRDAIDGYRLQNGVDVHKLSILQQRLAEHVEAKHNNKNKQFYTWQRLTIGAAAAVLFLVACSLIFFRYFSHTASERTHQVMLMEEQFRLQITALQGSDAMPIQGWDSFNEELNTEIRDVAEKGELEMQFNVVSNRVKNVEFIKNTNNSLAIAVANFLQQKVIWEGNVGRLRIIVDSKK